MRQLTESGAIELADYGGKAVGIWELAGRGLPVPPTVSLAVGEASQVDRVQGAAILEHLGVHPNGPIGLAIRSSSPDEDTEHASGAGWYESRLVPADQLGSVDDFLEHVRAVGHQRGHDIGVIVQPLIAAAFGGAAFGLDVRDHDRTRYTITWVGGSASAMLAGEEIGDEAFIGVDDEQPSALPQTLRDAWRAIRDALSKMQSAHAPADIEWILPVGGDAPIFVQCRRVVLPISEAIDLGDPNSFARIPPSIRAHPKIRVREAAASAGVRCSGGLLYVESGVARGAGDRRPPELHSGSAVSVVLLAPRILAGQVKRTFVGRQSPNVESLVQECHRYAIRSYPPTTDVIATVHDTVAAGLTQSWLVGAVAMEVLPFRLSGLASRADDVITIEIAEGHFVPKGIVATSVFLVENDRVVAIERGDQQVAFRIVDGYVLEERPVDRRELNDDLISTIAHELEPLLEMPTIGGVEFGVIFDPDPRVFVIDASDAGQDQLPASELMTSGVLSPGRGAGTALRLELRGPGASMDAHLFDESRLGSPESRVFLAERPALELLDLANTVDRSCAFVFREASILSHLIVVLRERGIPAVAVGASFDSIPSGVPIDVDALSSHLPRERRWSVQTT